MRETPSGLAVIEDFHRGHTTGGTQAFASAPVDMLDDKGRRRASEGSNAWQKEAWTYFDDLEEVKFAARFRGALMRRITMFVGYQAAAGQPPVEAGDAAAAGDLPAEIAEAAIAELDRLGSSDQQAEILGEWGMVSTISADSYLVGRDEPLSDSGEKWQLFSESNVTRAPDGRALGVRDRPGGPVAPLVPGQDAIVRVWSPHARWPALADANMRAVLGTAEEILIYARQLRAVGKSRTPSNLLYVANEIGDPPRPDGQPTAWELQLGTALAAAITEDGAASSVMPTVVRGPAAFGTGQRQVPAKDAIFTIDLARAIDQQVLPRLEILIKRLAHGLDVPVEVVTGIADINHWGAWQIEDSTYRAHIEPDALTFTNAVTAEIVRPGLFETFGPAAIPFIRRIVVRPNPAALVVRPNRGQDAKDAFDRGALSWSALRDHLNFSDDEAPDEAELLMRLALYRSIGAATLTAPMLEETGLFPGAIDGMAQVAEAQAEAQAAADPASPADTDQPTPATDPATEARTRLAALRRQLPETTRNISESNFNVSGDVSEYRPVSASTQVTPTANSGQIAANVSNIRAGNFATRSDFAATLGSTLASIDRSLFDRLLLASAEALTAALRVAGNRLKNSVQGNPAAADAVRGVAPDQVAAALLAAGLPVPDIEPLVVDQFGDLGERFDTWVAAGFAATADAIARAVPDDEPDTAQRATSDALEDQTERTGAGWASLATALVALAVARTLDPNAETPDGEFDALVRIPGGIVRNALAAAGGVDAPGAQPSGLAGEIGPGQTVGMLATGPRTQRALRTAGYTVASWEWHHSFVTDPLRVHVDLHGTRFGSWHDDALINTAAFPPFGYLFPGDHAGCRCSTSPILAPITEG